MMRLIAVAVLALAVPVAGAWAQASAEGAASAPAEGHPPGVSVGKTKLGPVHVDGRGRTLYALNLRVARSRSGEGLKYCTGPCADIWAPFAAPAGARPVGRWTVVEGVAGRQWAYRENPVFTYRPDPRRGSTAGDGLDDLWSVVAYVPPAPVLVAPSNVVPLLVDGAFLLADRDGRALFTLAPRPACGARCPSPTPLAAGLASRNIGEWTVIRDGGSPRWAYRGRPVYVSTEPAATKAPPEGILLRP